MGANVVRSILPDYNDRPARVYESLLKKQKALRRAGGTIAQNYDHPDVLGILPAIFREFHLDF